MNSSMILTDDDQLFILSLGEYFTSTGTEIKISELKLANMPGVYMVDSGKSIIVLLIGNQPEGAFAVIQAAMRTFQENSFSGKLLKDMIQVFPSDYDNVKNAADKIVGMLTPPAQREIVYRKAKEWAAEIMAIKNENGWTTTLSDIMRSLASEYLQLVKSRGETPNACIGAARQVNEKYNAIARQVNRPDGQGLQKDGFLKYLDANTSGQFRFYILLDKKKTEDARSSSAV